MILRRQDGIASLVGVSLTAFLILILTIAIATFMNGELQRATDYSDNIQAYYNAQSAAEEAVLGIKTVMNSPAGQDPNNSLASLLNQGCDSSQPHPDGTSILPGITCTQVEASSADAIGTLDNNQVIQYDLTNAPSQQNYSISELGLQWDMKFPPPGGGSFPSPSASALTSSSASWDPTTPPVIEMTVTNYFPGQQTNVDQTTNSCAGGVSAGTCSSGTVFLFPQWQTCNGGNPCPATVNYQAAAKNSIPGSNGQQPVVYSGCTAASPGGYRCKIGFTNVAPPGYKTIVRLESRFGDAQYDLSGVDSNSVKVQMPLQNAQIDVTANVGDAYNRVEVEVPIRSSVYPGFSTLAGESSLCKDFDVLTDPVSGSVITRIDPAGGCQLSGQGP